MSTVVDNLVVNVRSNTAQAVAGVGAVETRVRGLQTAVAGLATFGATLTKFVTLPVLALGAIGIKTFADFDQAMTESLAIMSDEAMTFRSDMEKVARDVAKTTTFSAEQAAASYFFLASAGLDAKQSMAALPAVAAFAQAGMFDMATATDLATDAQSALGLISDDSAVNLENLVRVTDVFVRANTLANASVEQFSSAITNKAGAALRAVGKDIEEGTAVLAAFADQGLKGEAAGTALHIVMRDLQSAAIKNTDAWKDLGVSTFDADGEMRNMADIIGDLEGLLGGMSDEQKKVTLAQLGFTDKSIGFLQMIVGQSDAIREYEAALRDAGGFTEDVAGKQLESFTSKMSLLKSKLLDIALVIGSVLVPRIADLVDQISPTIDKIADWIEANKELSVQILGIVAAVGPAFLILSKLVTVFALLASPIGLVVVALAAIAYAAYQMGFRFEDIMPIIKKVQEFMMDKIAILADWWAEHGDAIMETLTEIGDWIRDVWEEIWKFLEPLLQDMGKFIMEVFGETVEWFKENWPAIQETIERVMAIIGEIMKVAWPAIQKIIMGVWDVIKGIIKGALEVIKGVMEVVMGLIRGDWSQVWNGIKRIVNGVWQAIHGIVKGALRILGALIENALGLVFAIWSTAWDKFKGVVTGIGEAIGNILRGPIESFMGWFVNKVNWVIDKINGLIGAINKLPGPDIAKISRINLGHGGIVGSLGTVRVGDRGLPESVTLPAGATVNPLRPGPEANGGSPGGININLNAPQNDPLGIAREVGWELTKRGL